MALNRRRILHGASMGGLLLAAIGCGDDAAPAKPGDASKPGANTEVNSATGKGTPTVAAFTGAPLEIKASDKELLEAAKPEGKVLVYSTTDSASAKPLIADFNARYPEIKLDYLDLNSTDLFNKFTAETAAGTDTADVLWSSAMDQQMKMMQDGLGGSYQSPEADKLPQWAKYQEPGKTAWGTTLEPFAFVYNKKLLPADAVPKDHTALIKLLTDKTDLLKGKVTCYDPEKSGTGYLANSRDVTNFPAFWDLAAALGKADVKLYTSTGTMIEKIQSGEHIFGFNIIGSQAEDRRGYLRHGLSSGLHHRVLPGGVHRKEVEAPEFCQAVPGSPALQAWTGHPCQAVTSLPIAHRCGRRSHSIWSPEGTRRQVEANPGFKPGPRCARPDKASCVRREMAESPGTQLGRVPLPMVADAC